MSTLRATQWILALSVAVCSAAHSAPASADQTTNFATGGYANSLRSEEILDGMDTDRDGMISKSEWDAYQEKVFTALDVHHKSTLSTSIFVSRRCARLVSFATGGFANGLCSGRTGREIDTNHDGRITHSEFMAFQGKIFVAMDTSVAHPGVLVKQELFATGGSANR
jgi:hypothetical protein